MVKFKILEDRERQVKSDFEKALMAQYPRERKVGVKLNSRQIHPSEATVVGCGWMAGYVRVRLTKRNRHGKQRCIDVHWKQIIGARRLICLPCAELHDLEPEFRASDLRTRSGQGDGGCNLCGEDRPLAEVQF